MFKRIVTVVFIILLAAQFAYTQERPQYTQYIFNNYLLNPALGGIENYVDVKVGHRDQWAGLDGAPTTSFFSVHWALGDNYLWKNPLSLPEIGEDPMHKNYMQNYMSSPAHHGVGFVAVKDKTGPISRIDAGITYAYHLQLSGINNLSVGVYGGASRVALDVDALVLESQSDAALPNYRFAQIKPDLGVGAWFYGARFFAGVALQQVLPQKLAFIYDNRTSSRKIAPHLFLTSGYKLFWDDYVSIIPSFMLKHIQGIPVSLDVNLKASYLDKLWLGGSYRKSDSFSAFVGFNFKNYANLTYAYDFTTSPINTVSNGSHEIVLGLQLNNTYRVFSKKRF